MYASECHMTKGISIVKYTGTGNNETIGHGLSATPEFIVVKNLLFKFINN